ncbi:MAG: TolC family protein [Candidatus Rokubacteria bacterium]|nr:TolC family protein [Candidatus Rokubacteria bacterium]
METPSRWMIHALLTFTLVFLLGPTRSWAQTAPPPQSLSLEEATALALRQHPSIKAAEAGFVAADARIPQARSSFFPKVDTTLSSARSYSEGGTSFNGTSGTGSSTTTNNTTQLQLTQKIWDFGKTGALVDEAKANATVSQEEVDRVKNVVVLNVKTAYYGLLGAQRLVKVTEASLARSELNLRSARGFFEVGTKPKSDVTKAEVEVAQARVNLIRTRNAVKIAETTLNNALGLSTDLTFQVQDILSFEGAKFDLNQLREEAFRNRPELRQARARVVAADAQVRGARSAYYPDLNGVGSVSRTSDDYPPQDDNWSLSVTLTWNLFQGFFTRARLRETRANLEATRRNFDTLELQVRLEVEQAWLGMNEAEERIAATAKSVESAEENLRLAQGRYDAGVGTILELTDAQVALTQAQVDQVQALFDHKTARARLDNALGRR